MKRLFLTLVFSAILLLSISVSQQAFADTPVTIPAECDVTRGDSSDPAVTDHFLIGSALPATGDVGITAFDSVVPPVSQDVVFVLDPGTPSAVAQLETFFVGVVSTTFSGARDGNPHTVVACYGDAALDPQGNFNLQLFHTESYTFTSVFGSLPRVCGNGILDIFPTGEECDDGNTIDGDGCSAQCLVERPPPPVCGDGAVQTGLGEQCDDGGAIAGDGCSDTCQTEAGFTCTGQPSSCTAVCGDGIILGSEACDPPSAGICDLTCQFVTSSSGIVVSTTQVPQFCGLKQLAVVTPPIFTEVSQPLIFDETVDLQVSNEETLRVANTGGGAAVVNADLTLLDTDGETTDWEDLAGDTFDRCNTRQHHLSSQPYSSMTTICDNPFIEVLPGQTAPETNFVDRFLKVRPNAGDLAFSNAGTDLITFTQVLRLEVSCDPVATCPDAFPILDNGECVLD